MYRVASLAASVAVVEVARAFFMAPAWRWRVARALVSLRRLQRATDDHLRQRLMIAGGLRVLAVSALLGLFLALLCLGVAAIPWLFGLNQRQVYLYFTFLGIGSLCWMALRSRWHRA